MFNLIPQSPVNTCSSFTSSCGGNDGCERCLLPLLSLTPCLFTHKHLCRSGNWPLSSSLCKQQSGPQRYPPSEFLIFSIWPFGNCEVCFSTFISVLILGCGGVKFNELLNECCRSSLWIQWGCSREKTLPRFLCEIKGERLRVRRHISLRLAVSWYHLGVASTSFETRQTDAKAN